MIPVNAVSTARTVPANLTSVLFMITPAGIVTPGWLSITDAGLYDILAVCVHRDRGDLC